MFLQLPNQVLEANAGFSQEISLSKATRQSLEEEMTWGIDTRVEVQPKKTANVEVRLLNVLTIATQSLFRPYLCWPDGQRGLNWHTTEDDRSHSWTTPAN